MVKAAKVKVRAKGKPVKGIRKTREWGFILTILAIGSVFLGSTVVKIDLSFFQLYPLRLFGFVGILFMFSKERWKDPFLSFSTKFIFLFLFLGLASILWAPDSVSAIKEFGIIQTGLTLSFLIYRYINTEDRLDLVLKVWVIGAIFVNLIGIWEVWHQEYLISTNVGEKTSNAIIKMGFMAPRSIFSNQNNYAFFNALTALVLLGKLVKHYRPKSLYLLNIVSLSLSIFLLIACYSRAAIAGFVVGTTIFLIATFLSNNNYKRSLIKFVLLGFVMFAVVAVVDDRIFDSFSNLLNLVVEKNEQKEAEGRTVLYSESINYLIENLGFGMGPGSSVSNLDGLPPHNYFIQIAVEYGIVILLGQLWILYRVYKRLRLYRNVIHNAMPVMLSSSVIVFPILCVGPSTITGEGVFWLWLGLLIAYSSVMIRKYCTLHIR